MACGFDACRRRFAQLGFPAFDQIITAAVAPFQSKYRCEGFRDTQLAAPGRDLQICLPDHLLGGSCGLLPDRVIVKGVFRRHLFLEFGKQFSRALFSCRFQHSCSLLDQPPKVVAFDFVHRNHFIHLRGAASIAFRSQRVVPRIGPGNLPALSHSLKP